jgi:2-hydroxycyclohexanecarboxyl-CoA dehydrogenase
MRFEDKVAMVTGGASGIGEAVVMALTAEGGRVAICDIDREGGESLAGSQSRTLFIETDVTSTSSVLIGVERVHSELGPIDVLVNAAGSDVVKPFVETDEELWRWLIDLNLLGVMRTTKAVLPGMIEREQGRLINIASDAGRVGSSGEAAYSGAKGGVIAFTKTIAREVARFGITANTVSPGPTETPAMTRSIMDGGMAMVKSLERAIPMRRLGRPLDVAGAVAYFASDDASFITGQTLSVSGGMSMT